MEVASLLLHGAALSLVLQGQKGAGFAGAGSCRVSANAFALWQSHVVAFSFLLDLMWLYAGPAGVV